MPAQKKVVTPTQGPFAEHWKKVGTVRRSGVCVPLFSIYSEQDPAIGTFSCLDLLADWCEQTGISFIQLLPLNDTGFGFRPYDAESAFALDPMYLDLRLVPKTKLVAKVPAMPAPKAGESVDYGIKEKKLDWLRKVFESDIPAAQAVSKSYRLQNKFWIEDYALFRTLKTAHNLASWRQWPKDLRLRNKKALKKFADEHTTEIDFWVWVQYLLYSQMSQLKARLDKRGFRIMGDIPFLVSLDSADVWAHSECFKLDKVSGAPPDAFFADGQRWGMPPYNWPVIESRGYDILREKLKYAENFFHLFRIDHFVGLFRVWTFDAQDATRPGVFDPEDEALWHEHGRKIIEAMRQGTQMLPSAEDLGVVPTQATEALTDFQLTGIDVVKWTETFREYGVSVLSTHDTSSLRGWWAQEAGSLDRDTFVSKCKQRDIPVDHALGELFIEGTQPCQRLHWKPGMHLDLVLWNLQKPRHLVEDLVADFERTMHEKKKYADLFGLSDQEIQKPTASFCLKALVFSALTPCIFNVQLLQDWLSAEASWAEDDWSYRINVPGTFSPSNWCLRNPWSLEKMMSLEINPKLRALNRKARRS